MNRRLELEIIIQIPRTIEIYSKILFPTILCKIVHTLNLKKNSFGALEKMIERWVRTSKANEVKSVKKKKGVNNLTVFDVARF